MWPYSKIFVIAALILVGQSAIAQNLTPKVEVSESGLHVYIYGQFEGRMIFNNGDTLGEILNYYSGYYLAKFDTSGKVIWTKQLKNEIGWQSNLGDLCLDQTENIYVTGQFSDTLSIDSTSIFTRGSFIVKIDSSGQLLWTNIGKNSGGISLSADAFNNVYLSGHFYDTLQFDSPHILTTNATNIYLAKFDSVGQVQWLNEVKINDAGFFIPTLGFTVDNIGNSYTVGTFEDSLRIDHMSITTSIGDYEFFILKCDPDGNPLWVRNAAGSSNNFVYGSDVVVDSINNLFTTGTFIQSIQFGNLPALSTNTYRDFFLAHYNGNNGTPTWAHKGSLNQHMFHRYSNGISADENLNLFAVGEIGNAIQFAPLPSLSSISNTDHFLARLHATGSATCVTATGYYLQDVAADNYSNVYTVSGYANWPYDRITLSKWDKNCNAIWHVESQIYYSVNVAEYEKHVLLDVYPNPTSSILTIKSADRLFHIRSIELFSVTGERLRSREFAKSNFITSVDLHDISNGIYLLRICSEGDCIHKKVIKH